MEYLGSRAEKVTGPDYFEPITFAGFLEILPDGTG
jgi:hypothetical protein